MSSGPDDFEADLCRRIVVLMPSAFRLAGKQNLWPGEEVPAGGVVGEDVTFVEFVTLRHDLTEDNQVRFVDMAILVRFARGAQGPGMKERAAAKKTALELYRLLHCSAEFIGEGGGRYLTIRALDAPVFLSDRYFELNVTMWRDG